MIHSKNLAHLTRQLLTLGGLILMLGLAGSIWSASTASAQPLSPDGIWSDTPSNRPATVGERLIIPERYRAVTLNVGALQQLLQVTPLERSAAAQGTPVILSLPLPDGSMGRFQIVESPVMAPELAAQFPDIKTYAGQGIDDPSAIVRFDWTPAGFHAMILSTTDTVYIDPYSRGDTTNYISYYKRDFLPPAGKSFSEAPLIEADAAHAAELTAQRVRTGQKASGTQLRTYRLAIAANGEYTEFHGGTVPGAMAAIVTTVNRIDGIYEREVAISFQLIGNNNSLIYTNAATDPYTNEDASALLTENQANVDSVIGNNNYDIGHVFTTGGGGLAGLGVVCTTGQKARGETGSSSPVGDPYDVDYVAHEVGHQFGGNHTFNNNTNGSCAGNRNASTAYEPGSGSTIQAYAGICSPDNLQSNSDPYFSTISFDEIVTYSTEGNGNSCPVISNTGNAAPVVNAGTGGFTIPSQTPFTLTGSATDADGDPLTYSWEEFDLGNPSQANNALNPPFFRFFPPVSSPSRTFPKWSDIINNTTTIGEILPNVTRSLTFRLTARDNQTGGGGVNYASITFNVTTAAGPFRVTAPNTAVTWAGGSNQNVTWNVANTNAAPVSCANVKLLLSTDGGLTYPTTLAASVPNNGSASVTVPNIATTTARVQVACASSIFFDISNVNFTITSSAPTNTPTATPTATTVPSTATATPTATPTVPGNTPTSTATATATVPGNTPTSTPTATATTVPGNTPTATATATATGTPGSTAATIYISASANGTINGITYKDEDILAYSSGSGWSLFFDGSDVAIGNTDIDAFHIMDNGHILISLDKPVRIPPHGVVADADILEFTPSSLGNNTSGVFSLYFDGSDVGLTTGNEDIDGITLDASGNLLISTIGWHNVPVLSGPDEDLIRFAASSLGSNTSGSFSLYFDGSDVELKAGSEDIGGAWLDTTAGKLYLSTPGNFLATGSNVSVGGDSDDIFGCLLLSTGSNTNCNLFAFFDGDTVGFRKPVDGISLVLDSNAAQWSSLVAADSGVEVEVPQFEVLPDEPTEADTEMDEFDQTIEEESTLFLPLITR